MTDEILEKNLKSFDYSVFSKVKDSLYEELLQKHRRNNFKSLSQKLAASRLSFDELDYLAAAGNPFLNKDKKNSYDEH
jgi:hypothetical protein